MTYSTFIAPHFKKYRGGERGVRKEDLNNFDARLRKLEKQLHLGQPDVYAEGPIFVQFAERLYSNDLKLYKANPFILDIEQKAVDLIDVINPNITKPLYQDDPVVPIFDYYLDTTVDIWFRNPLFFTASVNERGIVQFIPRLHGFYLINLQCPGADENTDSDPSPPS